jgi:transposase
MYIELSDKQWSAIEPHLLPPVNYNGRPRSNDRAVLNGILYVLKTGCQGLQNMTCTIPPAGDA